MRHWKKVSLSHKNHPLSDGCSVKCLCQKEIRNQPKMLNDAQIGNTKIWKWVLLLTLALEVIFSIKNKESLLSILKYEGFIVNIQQNWKCFTKNSVNKKVKEIKGHSIYKIKTCNQPSFPNIKLKLVASLHLFW